MAVNMNSICKAIRIGKDCNTVCSMLWQMQPEELSLNQGNFLIEAVYNNRYDLLTAMVKELKFSVDTLSLQLKLFLPDFFGESTALFVSAIQNNRQMSKYLIQELKADVNKTWLYASSKTTDSVLTCLIRRGDLDELKFSLVSVL
jgi:hypothetical protein